MIFTLKNFIYILFMSIRNFLSSLFTFVHMLFYRKVQKIESQSIQRDADAIMNEFDQEYRYKEINELKPTRGEFKTNMLYAIEKLYEEVINATNRVYKKIQTLESNYSSIKSELDNKLYYELHNLEEKREEIESEIDKTDTEIEHFGRQKEEIEKEFNKVVNKEVVGDLQKHAKWVFWIIMLPAGMAEFFIYQNVFMSQEIGLQADVQENRQYLYELMSGVMSVGFIIMIIWMAHALGKFIRYFSTATKKERPYYIVKMLLIVLISGGAIWATVDIRGEMHEVMAINQKVKDLRNAQEGKEMEKLFQDETQESDDEGFGEDDMLEEDSLSADADTPQVSSDAQKIDTLENRAIEVKSATAPVFMLINFFIFLGGVFLSYFVHTSSPMYDMIVEEIEKLHRRKQQLQKDLLKIDKQIMLFKKYEIDFLFKKLLKEASLYDLHVRVYNTYLEIFYMKVELIENYLKNSFERFGIVVDDTDYKEFLQEHITVDNRTELHHVNRIDEYMIYKFTTPQRVKNLKEKDEK